MSKREDLIKERATRVGHYIIENKCTIRQCANALKISKSTVHKDTYRLKKINPILYKKTRNIIEINKEERAIRGGLSTKMKYKGKKAYPKELRADWIGQEVINN